MIAKEEKYIYPIRVSETLLGSPRPRCRYFQMNQFHHFAVLAALCTTTQPRTSQKHSTSLPVVST